MQRGNAMKWSERINTRQPPKKIYLIRFFSQLNELNLSENRRISEIINQEISKVNEINAKKFMLNSCAINTGRPMGVLC